MHEWKACNNFTKELDNLIKSKVKKNIQRRKITTDSHHGQAGIIFNNTEGNDYTKNDEPKSDSNGKSLPQQRSLQFDLRTIDWNEYFDHYLPGIKKYIFKEALDGKNVQHIHRYCGFLLFSWVYLHFGKKKK